MFKNCKTEYIDSQKMGCVISREFPFGKSFIIIQQEMKQREQMEEMKQLGAYNINKNGNTNKKN